MLLALILAMLFVVCLVGAFFGAMIEAAVDLDLSPSRKRVFTVVVTALCWPAVLAVGCGDWLGRRIRDGGRHE